MDRFYDKNKKAKKEGLGGFRTFNKRVYKKMIQYNKDPLFLMGKKNIYACLVKQKDLRGKNFGLRTPIVKINNNVVYDFPWEPLNNKELKVLSKEWTL